MTTTQALTVRDLSKTYPNGTVALTRVDLQVKEGDFFALLGPNGAGKSTIIGIVSSLVQKSAGKVSVYGYDLDRELSAAKSMIGIVPQEFNFNVWDTVQDIVVNQAGYYGLWRTQALKRAEVYLQKLGLWENRFNRARELSGGMKRRLMIARALVHEPRLLILDEPTAGVDIELRRSMWQFLRDINERGTTIILTTHYLEEAESLCENIAIIDRGEIVEDTDMKSLLNTLHRETFVLDLAAPMVEPLSIDNYVLRRIDDITLEADIERDQGVNELFKALSSKGVQVKSLRNKANRLEELFVSMIKSNEGTDTSTDVTVQVNTPL